MFSGIITHTTKVKRHQKSKTGLKVTFKKPADWSNFKLGESVSTNGVCLTVSGIRSNEYDCHLVSETLGKSTFGEKVPSEVSLERSLSAQDRIGGHFVLGHVDEVGAVTKIDKTKDWRVYIKFSSKNKNLVVNKGSIAIDGVALTIAEVKNSLFSVTLVPYTLNHTTLGSLQVGSKVNLEFDIIGKYVTKVMESRE